MNKESLEKQSWLQLISIQIGGAVCLPVLMIGQELGKTYGFSHALLAIIIGNSVLCVLGIINAIMAHATKATTIQNALRYFGGIGAHLLGIIMTTSLVGWFALQLIVISLSVQKSASLMFGITPQLMTLNIIIGVIISIVAVFGIKTLDVLSRISMPLLIGVLAYATYQAYGSGITPSITGKSYYHGVSLVMAAAILAVVDLPTYYRFARTKRAGIGSIILFFLLALPLLEYAGVYIGTHTNGNSLVDALIGTGGIIWQGAVVSFLVLAGWTTNNTNLYSATVVLEQLLPKSSLVLRTLVLGFAGTILSCLDILSSYEEVLNGMGILISSMGGVIAIQYLLQHINTHSCQHVSTISIASWASGVIGGLLSMNNILMFTDVPILDAFIIALISVVIFSSLTKGILCKKLPKTCSNL
ncbi:cytosine permease [Candidatus Dependentiae bacterium]|nr:cytosine permease [Candidatus Dependentiae bacterium]